MNQYLSNHMLFATICFPYLVVTSVRTVWCVYDNNTMNELSEDEDGERASGKQQLSKKVYNKIFTLFFLQLIGQ